MEVRRRPEVPLSIRFCRTKVGSRGSQAVTPPATLQSGEQKTKPKMAELFDEIVELGLLV